MARKPGARDAIFVVLKLRSGYPFLQSRLCDVFACVLDSRHPSGKSICSSRAGKLPHNKTELCHVLRRRGAVIERDAA